MPKIYEHLRPLYELWLIASKVGSVLPEWVEGPFEALDPLIIEQKTDEWVTDLKRLHKTQLVLSNPKQLEMQRYMEQSLVFFQSFLPLIRTLRTKGLASRHWTMMCNFVGAKLDYSSVNLFTLIKSNFATEKNMREIKRVCDVATKEFSLQQSLDKLDFDLKIVEFKFENTADESQVYITNLGEV